MGSQEFNIDVHFLSNFYDGFLKISSELHSCFGSLLAWNWTFLSSPELTKLLPWLHAGLPFVSPACVVTILAPEGAMACPLLLGCAAEADGCNAACSGGRRGLGVHVAG